MHQELYYTLRTSVAALPQVRSDVPGVAPRIFHAARAIAVGLIGGRIERLEFSS